MIIGSCLFCCSWITSIGLCECLHVGLCLGLFMSFYNSSFEFFLCLHITFVCFSVCLRLVFVGFSSYHQMTFVCFFVSLDMTFVGFPAYNHMTFVCLFCVFV